MLLLKVNYIFNACCFKRMSLLIWINATILEMLLSYFVFHQDKLDASFCRRLFHPPLLASNCFLFFLCWNRDIYSTCCYSKLKCHTGDFTWFQSNCTKRDWISYSCWQIRTWSCVRHDRLVLSFIHMIVQCALRCCATCIGTVLNKCWIEAIVLLSFPIK